MAWKPNVVSKRTKRFYRPTHNRIGRPKIFEEDNMYLMLNFMPKATIEAAKKKAKADGFKSFKALIRYLIEDIPSAATPPLRRIYVPSKNVPYQTYPIPKAPRKTVLRLKAWCKERQLPLYVVMYSALRLYTRESLHSIRGRKGAQEREWERYVRFRAVLHYNRSKHNNYRALHEALEKGELIPSQPNKDKRRNTHRPWNRYAIDPQVLEQIEGNPLPSPRKKDG